MRHIILLLVITLIGCTKDSKPCYTCDVGMSGTGAPGYKQDVCTDDIQQWQANLKDGNGNSLQSHCEPK